MKGRTCAAAPPFLATQRRSPGPPAKKGVCPWWVCLLSLPRSQRSQNRLQPRNARTLDRQGRLSTRFHCLARTRGSGVKTISMRGSCRARPRGVRRVDVFVGLAREKEVPFMRGSVHLERVRQAPEILLELLETRDWPRSWITPSNPLNLNGSETDLSVRFRPSQLRARDCTRADRAQEWLSESDRLSHA